MSHGHGGSSAGVPMHDANGLTTMEVEQRRQTYGFNEIRDRSKKWYQILWEQVYGDHWYPNSIPAMMWVAMIVSAAIQDWPDAGVIFGLHMFNSGLSFYETMKAGDAVAALRSALAPTWWGECGRFFFFRPQSPLLCFITPQLQARMHTSFIIISFFYLCTSLHSFPTCDYV